jgi:hypothetical protein
VTQQHIAARSVLGEPRDADTGANSYRLRTAHERPGQILEQLARRALGSVRFGRRQDDGEFVAAEPRHGVDRA